MTDNSNPVIDHCIVEHNSNIGINSDSNPSSTIRNTIISNSIDHGLRYASSGGLIENCIITGNGQSGIYNYGVGNLTIKNTNFINNTPCQFGGSGIFTGASNSLTISNCIFTGNSESKAIYNYTSFPTTNIVIQNSDFFNNSDGNFFNCSSYLGTIVTTNSNGTPCDAFYNIFEDPKINSDFTLKSGSPCIDAGLNSVVTCQKDIIDSLRIYDGNGNSVAIVDIGPFEYENPILTLLNNLPSLEDEIKIYPNPTNNNITIVAQNAKIDIMNMGGQILKTVNTYDLKTTIDLGNLSNGVYFFIIKTNNRTVTKKIIKQ